jgi:hypothetical protein
MTRINKAILGAVAALALSPITSHAIAFDFSQVNGGAEGMIGTSVNSNGVIATGYVGSLSTTAPLWVRNVDSDHGLGVCSEGEKACIEQGGQANELDNMDTGEGIVLENTTGLDWASLWVSSLDGNDGATEGEHGRIYWANTIGGLPAGGYFNFGYGDFGTNHEGDILTLAAAAGFDRTARYVLFVPDAVHGNDNDYLVWRGSVGVPEPSTLAVFGLGLLGLGLARRKRV